VLVRFFRAFLGRRSDELEYLVPAGARIAAVDDPVELLGIDSVAEPEREGGSERLVLATVQVRDPESGAIWATGRPTTVIVNSSPADAMHRLAAAGEAAVAGEGNHRGTSWVPGGRWLAEPGRAGCPVGVATTHAPASRRSCAVDLLAEAGAADVASLVRRSAMLGRRQARRPSETEACMRGSSLPGLRAWPALVRSAARRLVMTGRCRPWRSGDIGVGGGPHGECRGAACPA
jgi:hypothetical protein